MFLAVSICEVIFGFRTLDDGLELQEDNLRFERDIKMRASVQNPN